MNDVVISSSPADATAIETVKSHHAQLAGSLAARVAALEAVVRAGEEADETLTSLTVWSRGELLPHARGEEAALYPAGLAVPRARMLVEAMLAEHRAITRLVTQLESPGDGLRAVGLAHALQAMFEVHVAKENDQLLPVLAETPGVDLAELLSEMHDVLAEEGRGARAGHAGPGHGHECSCGEHDPAGDPELDARTVPHAIRHATVFGALDAVRPGAGLVLVAPHDPLPLLAQIEQRDPGAFEVSYLERGPEAWRLWFLRRAS